MIVLSAMVTLETNGENAVKATMGGDPFAIAIHWEY
jgi:hypothetical protein